MTEEMKEVHGGIKQKQLMQDKNHKLRKIILKNDYAHIF